MHPSVDAHVEDLNRRFSLDAVFPPFEVVIEPAQVAFEQQTVRIRTKIDVPELLTRPVSPRANRHACFLSGFRCAAVLAHTHVAVECAPEQQVEPPTMYMYRHLDFIEALFDADRLPVIVVALVPE